MIAIAIGLFLLNCSLAQDVDPLPDASQFLSLMHAAQAGLEDVCVEFESEELFVGPSNLTDEDPKALSRTTQGIMAYRVDGAALVDSYFRALDPMAMYMHRIEAMLHDQLTTQIWNSTGADSTPATRRVRLDMIAGPSTPLGVYRHWKFRSMEDAAAHNYQALRWEQVDGHRCLVVELTAFPVKDRTTPPPLIYRYWIDVDRGWQTVQVEMLRRGELTSQVRIQLQKITLPDTPPFWFPSQATHESFVWNGQNFNSPVYRDRLLFLLDEARWNQGLPDSFFTVAGDRNPNWLPTSVRPTPDLKAQYQQARHETQLENRKTTQQQLDGALQKAEQQSKSLDASPPAAPPWLTPALAITAGLALLLTAFILHKRLGR